MNNKIYANIFDEFYKFNNEKKIKPISRDCGLLKIIKEQNKEITKLKEEVARLTCVIEDNEVDNKKGII